MKVLIKSSGKIEEVSNGYARNYLIPKGLAVEATESVVRELAEEKSLKESKLKGEMEDLELMAKRLDGKKVVIRKRTGTASKLFGSINGSDICQAVKDQLGYVIDKKSVELVNPIKNLGTFYIKINFGRGVLVSLSLEVREEK